MWACRTAKTCPLVGLHGGWAAAHSEGTGPGSAQPDQKKMKIRALTSMRAVSGPLGSTRLVGLTLSSLSLTHSSAGAPA